MAGFNQKAFNKFFKVDDEEDKNSIKSELKKMREPAASTPSSPPITEEKADVEERVVATEAVKPVAAELVEGADHLTKKEKKEVILTLEDRRKLRNSLEKPATSLKDQFVEAISFFAPQIVGGAVGAIAGGAEGASAGISAGGALGDSFRKAQQGKKENEARDREFGLKEDIALSKGVKSVPPDFTEFVDKSGKPVANVGGKWADLAGNEISPSEIKKATVFSQASSLDQRKEELALRKQSQSNLEFDKSMRREERDLSRAINAKNTFSNRNDVKAFREKLNNLNDMEIILNDAPEIAVGTIPAKIARGIAGETGPLSDKDIARGQISPSFINNVKRFGEKFLTGKLPEEDVQQLKKLVSFLRARQQGKFRKVISDFGNSRSKDYHPEVSKRFTEDLLSEYGLVENKPAKMTEADIDNMSKEELKAFLGGNKNGR